MFIWRPIVEGKVSVADVKRGEVDIVDLLKLNAFVDYDQAARFATSKEKPR